MRVISAGLLSSAMLTVSLAGPAWAQDEAPADPGPPPSTPGSLPSPELLGPLSEMERVPIGEGQDLPLGEVLASVERHHPDLAVARQQLAGASGDQLAADGGFDLQLRAQAAVTPIGYYDWGRVDVLLEQPTPLWGATFFGGWRLGRGNEIQWYYGNYETLGAGELRAGVRVPLWQDGPIDSRRATLWRAQQGVTAAEGNLGAQTLSLRLAGTAAYVSWVAAGQRYAIVSGLLALAEERDGQLRERVRRGAIPGFEVLENRRVILSRRRQLVTARRALEQTAIALSMFLRDDDGQPRVVSPDRMPAMTSPSAAPPPAADEAVDIAWSRRPELVRFDAIREQARISLELAENRFAPRVDLTVQVSRDLGDYSSNQGTTSSGRQTNFGSQDTLEPTVVEGSLLVAMPLQFRAARGGIARARANLAAVDEQRRLMRDRISVQVRDALSALAAAEEGAELARQSADVAQAVAVGERRRFDLGRTQLFIVNLREQAAAQAEADAVNARAAVWVARARLDAALGGPQ